MKFGIVNITSFCNQKCIFCSEGDMHNSPKHIPYNKVIEILDNLKKEGVEGVNFMGGECTMRPDLKDILDYCNKNFKFVSIVTNGIMFISKKYTYEILSRVNSFEFSWHTNNKDKFNFLSGSNTYDLFQKSLINISDFLLENKNKGIIINHVINKQNYKDIYDNVKIFINKFDLKNRNNRVIALKRTNIVGYAKRNIALLSISPEKVLPYLKKGIEYAIKNKVIVQIEGFPPCYFKDFFESKYFIVNEMTNEDLFLLNKVDISTIENISDYFKKYYFDKKVYLRGNIELNKSILRKCRKCFFMKTCHKEILLGEDSNILDKDIINYIGDSLSYKNIYNNNIKRLKLLNNIIKGNT